MTKKKLIKALEEWQIEHKVFTDANFMDDEDEKEDLEYVTKELEKANSKIEAAKKAVV